MKVELMKSSFLLKVTTVFFVSVTLFFLFFGKQLSQSYGYDHLTFFTSNITAPSSIFNHSSPIVHVQTIQSSISPPLPPSASPPPPLSTSPPPPPSTSPPPPLSTSPPQSISPPTPTSKSLPPPRGLFKKFGIVNENGTMSDEFEVGEYDPEMVDGDRVNETRIQNSDLRNAPKFAIKRFRFCSSEMQDYIPCLDNKEAIKNLESTERGERFERHCPPQGKGLNCLVPPPKRYRYGIPWPKSRDEVWYNNVAQTQLVDGKRSQKLISNPKAKFKFPGGDTQFIHGVDQYLDHISKMVPEITFGQHIRVALDVDCGLASFGAYLLSRTVITMSVATKDVHENQIQFALERGVPAMVAAFATRRLLYPSQAFDLIHCSRCRINWTRDDGILLLEANRILRAGGYFVWDAQPVHKHKEASEEQWEEMVNLTTRLCWKVLKKDGYVTIWKKPSDNSCYLSREVGTKPPLCNPSDDPDNIWYVNLKACISPLPENGYGANVTRWPARLHTPPDRLQSIKIDAFISRKELFKAESKYWNEIIEGYVRALHWKKMKLRNVIDMRAGFGGFAAALIDRKLDCWVMNVVPVSGPNTLPVIYDRGLIGVMHDWCEPFDTYPRTYDLLYAANLLSVEKKRCNASSIMLEMDRILRPGGRAYIRDSIRIMNELVAIGKALGWRLSLRNTDEGPYAQYRLLICDKRKV